MLVFMDINKIVDNFKRWNKQSFDEILNHAVYQYDGDEVDLFLNTKPIIIHIIAATPTITNGTVSPVI
jgi:hypothetical protein